MIKYNSYNEAKNNGRVRMEGKDYSIKDNDVVYIIYLLKTLHHYFLQI